MYCKNCGKSIAADSKFCKYCGTLVEEESGANKLQDNSSTISKSTKNDSKTEVIVATKDESPVKIEIKKNPTIKKSTTANEVIANFKMIGWAILLWVVFIIGFVIVHQKDIMPIGEDSHWGESCYDPSILTNNHGSFNWKEIYNEKVKIAQKGGDMVDFFEQTLKHNPYDNYAKKRLTEEKKKANQFVLTDRIKERLTQEAKKEASANKTSLNNEITNIRKYSYEKDLHNNMIWVAIVSLALTIFGRYLIKFGKWVTNNKTE
jgi:hypothetical protein